MAGEGGVTRSIIDELVLVISKEIKWKVKIVLPEGSMRNVILRISKEIKWKMNVVLLEASLTNFIRQI